MYPIAATFAKTYSVVCGPGRTAVALLDPAKLPYCVRSIDLGGRPTAGPLSQV